MEEIMYYSFQYAKKCASLFPFLLSTNFLVTTIIACDQQRTTCQTEQSPTTQQTNCIQSNYLYEKKIPNSQISAQELENIKELRDAFTHDDIIIQIEQKKQIKKLITNSNPPHNNSKKHKKNINSILSKINYGPQDINDAKTFMYYLNSELTKNEFAQYISTFKQKITQLPTYDNTMLPWAQNPLVLHTADKRKKLSYLIIGQENDDNDNIENILHAKAKQFVEYLIPKVISTTGTKPLDKDIQTLDSSQVFFRHIYLTKEEKNKIVAEKDAWLKCKSMYLFVILDYMYCHQEYKNIANNIIKTFFQFPEEFVAPKEWYKKPSLELLDDTQQYMYKTLRCIIEYCIALSKTSRTTGILSDLLSMLPLYGLREVVYKQCQQDILTDTISTEQNTKTLQDAFMNKAQIIYQKYAQGILTDTIHEAQDIKTPPCTSMHKTNKQVIPTPQVFFFHIATILFDFGVYKPENTKTTECKFWSQYTEGEQWESSFWEEYKEMCCSIYDNEKAIDDNSKYNKKCMEIFYFFNIMQKHYNSLDKINCKGITQYIASIAAINKLDKKRWLSFLARNGKLVIQNILKSECTEELKSESECTTQNTQTKCLICNAITDAARSAEYQWVDIKSIYSDLLNKEKYPSDKQKKQQNNTNNNNILYLNDIFDDANCNLEPSDIKTKLLSIQNYFYMCDIKEKNNNKVKIDTLRLIIENTLLAKTATTEQEQQQNTKQQIDSTKLYKTISLLIEFLDKNPHDQNRYKDINTIISTKDLLIQNENIGLLLIYYIFYYIFNENGLSNDKSIFTCDRVETYIKDKQKEYTDKPNELLKSIIDNANTATSPSTTIAPTSSFSHPFIAFIINSDPKHLNADK